MLSSEEATCKLCLNACNAGTENRQATVHVQTGRQGRAQWCKRWQSRMRIHDGRPAGQHGPPPVVLVLVM